MSEDEPQKRIIGEMDETVSYQGYIFSPPLPEVEFMEKFLAD